jgi:glucose-6-phosphate 1-dehydrogenase
VCELVEQLGAAGLTEGARIVFEKPFGADLDSARALNARLHAVLDESQMFRIDHFLGRETVQNILALRLANGIFEPIWNRDHIDHVRIDVPETAGVGTRGRTYDETGAFRDMVVTHLFHVLALVAMEPPVSLESTMLVQEAAKVADAIAPLRPEDVVRGQYEGYRAERGVAPDSQTETYAALRVAVDNWRWAGVPFYLRTGKRLAAGQRAVTIAFRDPPLRMFGDAGGFASNELVFDLTDSGSISATFLAKAPGPTMRLAPATFTFDSARSPAGSAQLDGYERLIHDALLGDRTRFLRADGIERLWEISMPVLEAPPPLRPYEAGSSGPRGR